MEEAIVFHDGPPLSPRQADELGEIFIPFRYQPLLNGVEDSPSISLDEGLLLGGRYRVVTSRPASNQPPRPEPRRGCQAV